MRRDLDLIRNILLHLESDGQHEFDATQEQITEHLRLLCDGGLLTVLYRNQNGSTMLFMDTLLDNNEFIDDWRDMFGFTWKGHEFLNSIRNPIVYNKVVSAFKPIGGFTMEVLKEVTSAALKQVIGIP